MIVFLIVRFQGTVHRAHCVHPSMCSSRLKCSRSCCGPCRPRRLLRILCLHIMLRWGAFSRRRHRRGGRTRYCHLRLQASLGHRRLRHASSLRRLGSFSRRSSRHRVPRVQLRRSQSHCRCRSSRQRLLNRLVSKLLQRTFQGARIRSPWRHQRAHCTLASARCHRCC